VGAERSFKSAIKVLDDVFRRFDSDRQANESIRYALSAPGVRGHARVGCRCGASDQRFDASKAGRADGNFHAAHESLRLFNAAFQLNTPHAAETFKPFPGARMARMAFQTRIIDSLDGRVLFEKSRNL